VIPLAVRPLAALALAAAALTVACSSADPGHDGVGTIRMSLTLPGGATVSRVDWRILSAAGVPLVTGSIATDDPNATASVDTSCPASTGDTLEMSATTSAGVVCRGLSAPFDVAAGATAAAMVTLVCNGGPTMSSSGSVVGTGTFVDGNLCPVLTTWVASPLSTSSSGGRVDVSAAAVDANPGEILSYAWAASPSGVFLDPSSQTTVYACDVDSEGPQTLTLTATDSHSPPCSVTVTMPVFCVGDAEDRCLQCEMRSQSDSCNPALLTVPHQPAWGCDGFSGAARASCLLLLSCVRGNGAQGRCMVPSATGGPPDDPVPCLCGARDVSDCVTMGAPPDAPCAAEYAAAAAGLPGGVFMQFNDPSSPVGIADNLAACDADGGCGNVCRLR
jgi:hypothetical protein